MSISVGAVSRYSPYCSGASDEQILYTVTFVDIRRPLVPPSIVTSDSTPRMPASGRGEAPIPQIGGVTLLAFAVFGGSRVKRVGGSPPPLLTFTDSPRLRGVLSFSQPVACPLRAGACPCSSTPPSRPAKLEESAPQRLSSFSFQTRVIGNRRVKRLSNCLVIFGVSVGRRIVGQDFLDDLIDNGARIDAVLVVDRP